MSRQRSRALHWLRLLNQDSVITARQFLLLFFQLAQSKHSLKFLWREKKGRKKKSLRLKTRSHSLADPSLGQRTDINYNAPKKKSILKPGKKYSPGNLNFAMSQRALLKAPNSSKHWLAHLAKYPVALRETMFQPEIFSSFWIQLIFPFFGATIHEETSMNMKCEDCLNTRMSEQAAFFIYYNAYNCQKRRKWWNGWIMKTKQQKRAADTRRKVEDSSSTSDAETCFQRCSSSSEISVSAHQLV